jgi:hypothetical protein
MKQLLFLLAAIISLGAEAQTLTRTLTIRRTPAASTNDIPVWISGRLQWQSPTQYKTILALENVTNTSDANKPVSTAQQAALDLKAALSSPQFTNQIGVGVASTASARIALPTGTTAAEGILFGDISFFRIGPNTISVNSGAGQFNLGALSNGSTANNAYLSMGANGVVVSRNIADANNALITDLVHASSTGKIASFRAAGSEVAYVSKAGLGYFSGFQTSTTAENSNIYAGTSGVNTTTNWTLGGSTGVTFRNMFGGSTAITPISVNHSYGAHYFRTGGTITSAGSGTNPVGANVVIEGPSLAVGTAAWTNGTALYIPAASTGATNNYSIYAAGGNAYFGGALQVGNSNLITAAGIRKGSNTGAIDFETSSAGIYLNYNTTGTNSAFKVNNVHASNTGNIAEFQAASTTVASISRDGSVDARRLVPNMYNRNEFEHANLIGFGAIMEPLNVGFRDVNTSHSTVDGSCRCTLSYLPRDTTITGLRYFLTTAGAITGENNNKFAIYTVNTTTLLATLAASSANDETYFEGSANTLETVPFTSPYSATRGWYLMCYLYNISAAAVAPVFAAGTQHDIFNNAFWFSNGLTTNYSVPTQTDIPATIDLTTAAKTNHRQYIVAY